MENRARPAIRRSAERWHAAISAPIQQSRDRKSERGPAIAMPIASAAAQNNAPYLASNATPAITPAHQNARGSSSTSPRATKYAIAVNAIGSKVAVESVAVIAVTSVALAAATAASQAPRVLAPSNCANATVTGTRKIAASTAGSRRSQSVNARRLRRRREQRD